MALIIGYLVVLCIVALDFYYHTYINKKNKTFIYTPFDYLSGQLVYFDEVEKAQKTTEHKRQVK